MLPLLTPESLLRFAHWIQRTPNLFVGEQPVVKLPPLHDKQLLDCCEYQGNTRLGFIYQTLWQRWLEQSPTFEVCESELQLIDNKKTLGEIDFIVKNRINNQFEHWEVAIKFYLLQSDYWYGPNAIDRLDKKFTHMLERQLQHGQSLFFKTRYPQYPNLKLQLMLQGRLYTNPFSDEPIPSHCAGWPLNSSQIDGHWCYKSQLHLVSDTLYFVPKPLWAIGLTEFNTPITTFPNQPVHCQTQHGKFWFIVPDSWPHGS